MIIILRVTIHNPRKHQFAHLIKVYLRKNNLTVNNKLENILNINSNDNDN